MFINLHVLYTFAGANPNRDETGAPKSLVYGGVERSAMSSQAMTRAKRLAYEKDLAGERSYRSRDFSTWVTDIATEALTAAGVTFEADKVRAEAVKQVKSLITDADEKDGKKPTLVWLAESEIRTLAAKVAKKFADGTDIDGFLVSGKTASLSIAAFGRMFAQKPDLQNEASIQRATAFTTHEAVVDVDYFTAVDDLNPGGAGYLDSKMNTGGVYYWHCSIDVDHLLNSWTPNPDEVPGDRLNALVKALVEALPSGKEATSAHHTAPAFVLAVPAERPVSLQSAFEAPVRENGAGYLSPSVEALLAEHTLVTEFMPSSFPQPSVYAGTVRTETTAADNLTSLDAIAEHCARLITGE